MGDSEDEDAYLYGSDDEQKTAIHVDEASGSDNSSDSEDDIDIIIGDTPLNEDKKEEVKKEGTKEEAKEEPKEGVTIDVNSVAQHNGKPITSLDLSSFKDKPWRAPGADISDYFNYGFDEFSWTEYTSKQDSLRGEYNPQKLMNELIAAKRMPPNSQVLANTPMPMMGFPGMPMNGMGMQGMPMPPPGFPMPPPGMNMKNMPMPPNFKR